MAKALYGALFDWIVDQVGVAIIVNQSVLATRLYYVDISLFQLSGEWLSCVQWCKRRTQGEEGQQCHVTIMGCHMTCDHCDVMWPSWDVMGCHGMSHDLRPLWCHVITSQSVASCVYNLMCIYIYLFRATQLVCWISLVLRYSRGTHLNSSVSTTPTNSCNNTSTNTSLNWSRYAVTMATVWVAYGL